MTTTRRSPITGAVRENLESEAIAFLGDQYDLDAAQRTALAGVAVVWKNGRRRRMAYYRPVHTRTGRAPFISIAIPPGSESSWITYDRVHARLTTPTGGIEVPVLLRLVLCLVHEYTHAIQNGVCGGRKRRFLEAEPTKNEIEYVRQNVPDVHAQLVPVRRRTPAKPPATANAATQHRHIARRVLRRWRRKRS